MPKTPKNSEPRTERHEHHIHQEKSPAEWFWEIAIGLMVLGTLIATSVAAYWTSQQWATADDQEKRQLRAYVGLNPGDLEDLGDPEKQRWSGMRKNYGQTPAYDVSVIVFGQSVIKRGQPIVMGNPQPPPEIRGTITLFPQAELVMRIAGLGVPKEHVMQVVNSDDFQFVYFGTIQYHDIFGKRQFTYFCWMYDRKHTSAKDADGCYGHNNST